MTALDLTRLKALAEAAPGPIPDPGSPDIKGDFERYMAFASAFRPSVVLELIARLERAEAQAQRYEWLADRVLGCDYGDNDKPGQIGWRIRHDLLPKDGGRQPAFMYGNSINKAVDAARGATTPNDPLDDVLPLRPLRMPDNFPKSLDLGDTEGGACD
jgi:hypothetical protein